MAEPATSAVSPSSTVETRSKRSKSKKEMNIEEVFASVSNVQASGLNPPPARTVLTPRSAESCLKHGINPEILRIRDLESFYDPNVDPAIQSMRHDAYSNRRHEMMGLVRAERKKIVNAEVAAGQGAGGDSGLTPGAILAAQSKQNATFVELEEKRMLKMKKRQEKEIEQMLQFEVKMADIAEERERRAKLEADKEERRKREKLKRAKLLAEERRLKELRRAAMADAEEEMRLQKQKQMHAKEKAIQAEKEARERAMKKEAIANEEERKKKAEEFRQDTQRKLEQQQAAIKAKMEEMDAAEKLRQQRIKEEEELKKQQMEEKRKAVEERIARNMKMAAKIEEKRKKEFYEKQKHHEQLRAEHLQAQERDRELQARQQQLMEQRRLLVLAQTRRDEERKKQARIQSFIDQEINVQRVREDRERHQMLMKEKKDLKTAMKLENVNRIKRIAEYKRLETLRNIHEGDKRIDMMLNRKAEIVEARRANAISVKITKDNLIKVMEDAKANGNKASKLIKKFLSSGSVTSETGEGKKKKGQRKRISQAKTAPLSDSTQPLGPKPVSNTLEARFDSTTDGQPNAYISPYDTDGGGTATVTF
jgi:hypothetical protein